MSKKDQTTIQQILIKHNVYNQDLELDLLRYFEKMRDLILKTKESTQGSA